MIYMVEETASAFEMQHFQHPLEAYTPQDVMHGIIRRVVVPCNQRPKGFNPASIRHLTSFDSVTTHGSNMLRLFSSLCLTCQCSPTRPQFMESATFQHQIPSTVTESGSKIDQLGFIGFTLASHCPICQKRLPVPSCSILFHL